MTDIVKKSTNKLSTKKPLGKKQMQLALKQEIERIDSELAKLGIYGEIVYKCSGITNFETNQNTINISGMTDLNMLLRFLSHYENLKNNTDKYIKEFNVIATQGILNVNQIPVQNIIHDLVLRIKILTNSTKINNLNAARTKLMPFLDEDSRLVNTLKEVQDLYKEIK